MKMNRKQVRNSLIVAILIVVLCASSYYYGVSSSYVGTTSEVWVNPPFSEASYVVGQYNSTYYYAKNGTTGNYDYLSSNASYVINSAITACKYKGLVHLQSVTYVLDSSIMLVGLGTDYDHPASGVSLIGEGYGTILHQNGVNKDGIIIKNAWGGQLRDLRIEMPTSNSGYGIHGMDNGANATYSVMNAYIGEIAIEGSDSSHACMYLQNPFFSTFGFLHLTNNNGDALVLEATHPTINVGNCHFQHIKIGSAGQGHYGVTLKATQPSSYINLVKFEQIQAYCAGIPIFLHVNRTSDINFCWFEGLDLEGGGEVGNTEIYIKADDAGSHIAQNDFKGEMWLHSGKTAIRFESAGVGTQISAFENSFDLGVYMDDVATNTALFNESYTQGPNQYSFNILLASGTALTTNQFIYTWGRPKVTWLLTTPGGYSFSNPHSGRTASVSNGTWIPHYVGITPLYVTCSNSVKGEFVSVIAVNATHFQVGIVNYNGTAGTQQTIYWQAGW